MEVGDKGICRLSVIPVRKEPSDRAEMVTQLLFGEHYAITEISENQEWIKINIYADHYEGWIDSKQHTSISPEYYEQINVSDYKISLDKFSTILFKKSPLAIVAGSILPISTNELFKMEEQLAFNGESKSLSQKRDFEFLKIQGMMYLNTPYLWGGKTPLGIDCSGLIQVLFKMAGYYLPRDASQQVKSGHHIQEIKDYHPGDLAFFAKENGNITHVGLLLEDNAILHSSGKVRIDKIDENGIVNSDSGKYTHQLSQIRRILKE